MKREEEKRKKKKGRGENDEPFSLPQGKKRKVKKIDSASPKKSLCRKMPQERTRTKSPKGGEEKRGAANRCAR